MNHRFLWVALLASIDDNSCRKITRAHTGHAFVVTWNPRTLLLQRSPECIFSCERRVKHYWQRCFDTILIRGYISPLSLPERPPWMQASTTKAALGALGNGLKIPPLEADMEESGLFRSYVVSSSFDPHGPPVRCDVCGLCREPRWLSPQWWLKGPI